jgi:hypothetical protein
VLTTVLLYGPLGKQFGRRFKLDVHSPKEVVDALSMRFPNFRQTILEMEDVDFGVKVGGNEISENRLAFPNLGKTITITPVARGSMDKGWINVIAGVVLIAGGIAFGSVLGPFAAPVEPADRQRHRDQDQAELSVRDHCEHGRERRVRPRVLRAGPLDWQLRRERRIRHSGHHTRLDIRRNHVQRRHRPGRPANLLQPGLRHSLMRCRIRKRNAGR